MPAENHSQQPVTSVPVDDLLAGQQRVLGILERQGSQLAELSSEILKFSHAHRGAVDEVSEIRSDVQKLVSDFDRRFEGLERRSDAIAYRLEEPEQVGDRLLRELHALRTEVAVQRNEIINAVQAGQVAQLDVKELIRQVEEIRSRLDELERRFGQR